MYGDDEGELESLKKLVSQFKIRLAQNKYVDDVFIEVNKFVVARYNKLNMESVQEVGAIGIKTSCT